MGFSYTFAGVTEASGAQLDTVLNQAGLLGTLACTIVGTNTLVLTAAVSAPAIVSQTQLRVSGVAQHTNTGATTADAGFGAYAVYKDGAAGPAALAGGEIVIGNYIVLAFDTALAGGSGGWHLENAPIGGAPTGTAGGDLSGTYPNPAVAKIGGVALGSATATAGNILVGSGAAWVTKALSGDATLASTGAITVTKTGGVNLSGGATATFVAPTSWTPADASGAGLTFSGVNAKYNRDGNIVYAYFCFTFPVTADGSNTLISGLPIAVPNQTYAQGPAIAWVTGSGGSVGVIPIANTSTARFFRPSTGATMINSELSGLTATAMLIYPVS